MMDSDSELYRSQSPIANLCEKLNSYTMSKKVPKREENHTEVRQPFGSEKAS